jgi:cobalt/nickel transport system permease protein
MHVPDGFLTNRIALALDVLSASSILYAARRLHVEIYSRLIPIMGVLSAFIFAAQMLNFPVFGGTSGHLVGGALLGIILGPLAGLVSMATVIIFQALFLQDGGLIALGANVFNIGAITVFSGFAVFRLLGSPEGRGRRLAIAGFLSGWISVVLSAAACAFELGLSGAVPLRIGLPAMTGYHAVIGVVEGALTAGVLSFLSRVRPDLLKREFSPRWRAADWVGGVVLVGMPLGIMVLAGSSSLPDPLQSMLLAVPVVAEGRNGLLPPDRFAAWIRPALYGGLPVLCALAYLGARLLRKRKGNP